MIILKKIQSKGEKNRKEWHAYTVYMNSANKRNEHWKQVISAQIF
jgi:hypothetical protein